jgi:predicted metal-dependent hydrolase
MTTKLKNKVRPEFKLKDMNNNTYVLRRKVIDIIYMLKKHINLPRIEVRIVSTIESTNICGYAYMNKNIIHINESYCNDNNEVLTYLVCHEIVHAVIGIGHNPKCYLIPANMISYNKISNEKTIEVFKTYFKSI